MSETAFSSEDECCAFVVQQLLVEGLEPDIVQKIAARLTRACEHHAAPRLGAGYRVRRWVIRQEDLGFFSVLRTAAVAAVAAMSAAPMAAPIVGAVAAVAETGWNIWRKGARIEALDLRLLALLEQSPNGLAAGEIAARLSDKTKKWSVDDIEEILKKLSKLTTRSGTTPVVVEAFDGHWRSTH